MRTSMREDLRTAMKAKDRVAVGALRSVLAAIENAEAQPAVPADATTGDEHVAGSAVGLWAGEAERRQLTDADVRSIVQREVDDRSSAAAEYERVGRDELAGQLRTEADLLSRYLTHP